MKIINKNLKTRNGSIHLYNPKKEGLGSYDIHYMNAYSKNNRQSNHLKTENNESKVA
tara:strand:+ start:5868 stop:6038 length:171 start_codon:yes stop_codon:yes gene_type:complete